MIKFISAFKRKPGMSLEAFTEYWRTAHAEAVVKVPNLKRYVQSQAIESAYRTGEPVYDGLAELWYEDTAAMRRAAESPASLAALKDDVNFIDMNTFANVLTEEIMLKEGPRDSSMLKIATFLFRKPDLAVEPFQKYWREKHGPLAAKIPQVLRYAQSHARASSYRDGRVPAFDGVAEVWLENIEAARASSKTPEYAAVRVDELNFLDQPRARFIITRERVFI
ncbi:MAG: EthD family reductase [Candidatus Binataceae bacterium]